MVNDFKIKKIGVDFMGYTVDKKSSKFLSFHHLIIPHRECKELGLGEGFLYCNGAILVQNTAHDYLHLIERYDLDIFDAITSEMIDQKIKGYLDTQNMKYIDSCLKSFEREYADVRDKKGDRILKREYLQRPFR